MRVFFSLILVVSLLWLRPLSGSTTLLTSADCFQWAGNDAPSIEMGSVENWCYIPTDDHETNFLLINRDARGEFKLAHSYLVELSSDGSFKSFSQPVETAGITKIHSKLSPRLFPSSIPAQPREARSIGISVRSEFSNEEAQTISKILGAYHKGPRVNYRAPIITEGKVTGGVANEKLPFGSYWWPYDKEELFNTSFSPLAKHDLIHKAHFGVDPQSIIWERDHHSNAAQVAWGGHCNGWAASAILYRETEGPYWEPKSETLLQLSDLNGMLAEASFCVHYNFYGKRYWTEADDLLDIYPAQFHEVLLYAIQTLKRPIAIDIENKQEVWNRAISGFDLNIAKHATEPNTFEVNGTISTYTPEGGINDMVNVAPMENVTFSYTLITDAAGQITGGAWNLGIRNPDFLWLPLSQKMCGSENPKVSTVLIDKLLKLPKAVLKPATLPINYKLSDTLQPNQTITVLFATPLKGAAFALYVSENTYPKVMVRPIFKTMNVVTGFEVSYSGTEPATGKLQVLKLGFQQLQEPEL